MIARTELAILDYNTGIGLEQPETKDGTKCFKHVFYKVTESWCVEKVLSQKSCPYLEILMKTKVDLKTTKPFKYCLPIIPSIPQHISSVEKPGKDEAIHVMHTRFECV